jgi:hypothetical protein
MRLGIEQPISLVDECQGHAKIPAEKPSMAIPETTPPPSRWGVAPYFIVDDVVATANFYRDRLGFRYERFCGEPPCFTMVGRNGITIMLKQPRWTVYTYTENALHALLRPHYLKAKGPRLI